MATLAINTAVSLSLRDGGQIEITTTGGAASYSVTPASGAAETRNIGAYPESLVVGPYVNGATLVITNLTAALSYRYIGGNIATLTTDADGVLTGLAGPTGAILALSEVSDVVNISATGIAFTGACEFGGFVVRSQTGGTADITIYDALSATGTAIMTVSNVVVGAYLWAGDWATAGVGTNLRRANTTGCWVVISGTANIDVLVS